MGTRIERLLNQAKLFLGLGWIPIALKGKVPLARNWTQITSSDALPNIQSFIENGRLNNLGIITGAISKIIVVDIDVKNDGMIRWKELLEFNKGVELPNTFTVKTGTDGLHIFFRYLDNISDIINI